MAHDDDRPRFFSYLNLFTFFMLLLVLGGSLPLLFVGWEGVGLCSYLLIGFWYKRDSAAAAGPQGLRGEPHRRRRPHPGDDLHLPRLRQPRPRGHRRQRGGPGAGGALAVGPGDDRLPPAVPGGHRQERADPAARLAAGRDGGPDAGLRPHPRGHDGDRGRLHGGAPRPALPPVRDGDAGGGGDGSGRPRSWRGRSRSSRPTSSACWPTRRSASSASCSSPRAWAPSGWRSSTSTPTPSSRRSSSSAPAPSSTRCPASRTCGRWAGLRKKIPWTFGTFLVGTLAIAGIPPLAGFFSKDEILLGALGSGHTVLFGIALFTALLTAAYMARLLFLTFFGEFRGGHEAEHHVHESPWSMLVPLVLLAIGSAAGRLRRGSRTSCSRSCACPRRPPTTWPGSRSWRRSPASSAS